MEAEDDDDPATLSSSCMLAIDSVISLTSNVSRVLTFCGRVRFFTVDRSHSGKHGGFGLGLAVVKKLCDRAGWRLKVDSELGKGTTFRIEF